MLNILSMLARLSFPKKIYRYIFLEIWTPFFPVFSFLLLLTLAFQIMRLSELLLLNWTSFSTIADIFIYLTVSYLPILLPFSFLISILLGLGRLSADGEINAIRSIGFSIYQLSFPIILSGLFLSIISLVFNLYLVPWGNRMIRYELLNINEIINVSNIKEGKFNDSFPDIVLYVEKTHLETGKLNGIFIHSNKKGLSLNILAKQGMILKQKSDIRELSGPIFRLWDGLIHRIDLEKEEQEIIKFGRYDIFFRTKLIGISRAEKPKTMDQSVLKWKIENGSSPAKLLLEYWKRIALSWSSFIFSFLGVGLGAMQLNATRYRTFLLAALIILSYWLLYSLGFYWGDKKIIPAALAMWLANIFLFCLAMLCFRKAIK